jgi:hypothetical protein
MGQPSRSTANDGEKLSGAGAAPNSERKPLILRRYLNWGIAGYRQLYQQRTTSYPIRRIKDCTTFLSIDTIRNLE